MCWKSLSLIRCVLCSCCCCCCCFYFLLYFSPLLLFCYSRVWAFQVPWSPNCFSLSVKALLPSRESMEVSWFLTVIILIHHSHHPHSSFLSSTFSAPPPPEPSVLFLSCFLSFGSSAPLAPLCFCHAKAWRSVTSFVCLCLLFMLWIVYSRSSSFSLSSFCGQTRAR